MTGGSPPQPGPHVVLSLAGARAFVVGDVMVDRYLSGTVSRISPEAPVPVLRADEESAVLGGAANVAANVCGLGGRAVLCGLLGEDDAGRQLSELCAQAGVMLDDALRVPDARTTVKRRVVAGGQQLLRIDIEETRPATAADVSTVVTRLRAEFERGGVNVVVVSDYAKGTVTDEMAHHVIAAARSLGLPVVVDPKSTDLRRYDGATVIKPNLTEAREVAARVVGAPDRVDVETLCQTLHDMVDTAHLVVSLSAEGVALSSRNAPVRTFRSVAREVADVSGAGDTMVATLAASLGSGLAIEDAVHLGNLAAGVVCGHRGTAVVTADEIEKAIALESGPTESPHVVQDWGRLRALVDLRRRAGARVVFANGCFDLLHGGHVALLQEARRQGDVLVVGLNSDASTRRLKGPERPLQGIDDRLRVMAAVRFVDYATVFEEDTPIDLILALEPDVIVKGGDYAPESVVGGAEATRWGGRVHIANLVPGLSTTALSGR